jgi:hypothetical protein
VQTAIQPTGFVVLPVALLLTFPFGWAMAFYQNVSVFGGGEDGIRTVARKSWQQAMLYPTQNYTVLFIVFLFSTVVFVNVAIAIYMAPHLLKTFLGVETLFTKAGWNVLNTTFLAVAFGLTYLLVDPLVKTVYVLRCYYGDSLHTGEDLKVELKGLRAPAKAALGLLAISLLWSTVVSPKTAFAASEHSEQDAGSVVSVAELDRSISEVLGNREYAWRMPRDEEEEEESRGLLATFIATAFETLGKWFKPVKEWLYKAILWLVEKLAGIISLSPGKRPVGKGANRAVFFLVYSLLAVAACALALMLWRMWKGRRTSPVKAASSAEPYRPDITSEEVTADVLSTNSWLGLARELMERGEVRLALRALYLASLSHLAQRGAITIAAFKSNRDYERELQRRARAMPDLLSAFGRNMRIFESIWYGTHDVTNEILESFNENQERVMAFAEE